MENFETGTGIDNCNPAPALDRSPPIKTELMKYDAACRAVAEARLVDEVRDILDAAAATRAYARQAKNRELEADALEIRLRAERRLGAIMQAQKQVVGVNKGGGDQRSDHRGSQNPGGAQSQPKLPTLAEAGIDKNLAKRARSAATLPQEEFEEIIKEGRGKITAVSDRVTAKLVKSGASAQRPDNKGRGPAPPKVVDDKNAGSTHGRKNLQTAESGMIDVLNNFIRQFEVIDLHTVVGGMTREELQQLKITLGKIYDIFAETLPYFDGSNPGASRRTSATEGRAS